MQQTNYIGLKEEIAEIPYSQINTVNSDYTGVIGFCGVILFLGIVGYIICCFWVNKFFLHIKDIDNKKLEIEKNGYINITKKIDAIQVSIKEIMKK